jgi:hypothetical protein
MNIKPTSQREAISWQKIERDERQQVRDSLTLAEDQIERGEGITWGWAQLERLKREATENARRGKPIKDDVRP